MVTVEVKKYLAIDCKYEGNSQFSFKIGFAYDTKEKAERNLKRGEYEREIRLDQSILQVLPDLVKLARETDTELVK